MGSEMCIRDRNDDFSRAEASLKRRRCNALVNNRDFDYEELPDLILMK